VFVKSLVSNPAVCYDWDKSDQAGEAQMPGACLLHSNCKSVQGELNVTVSIDVIPTEAGHDFAGPQFVENCETII
jgi:hypothetical protein